MKIWDRAFGAKRQAEARATLKHAASFFTPGTHVLDIGCGVGYALEVLNYEMACVGYGCDVVRPPTEIPRFSIFDGDNLPFRDDAVDVALLVFVLHHAHDPGLLLREASRVARRAVVVVEDTPRTSVELNWGQMHVRSFARRHKIPWLGRVRGEQEWRQVFQFSSMPVMHVEQLGRFERLPPVSRSVFVLQPAEVAVEQPIEIRSAATS